MSERSRSGLPLVAIVATVALALAALVLWRETPTGRLHVGEPVPDFQLRDLEGRSIALSELRGRVVFVNFWGTFCPPCRDEAPALERLYRDLAGEGFAVLALSIDEPGDLAEVEAFRREFQLSFPILLDTARESYTAFGATGVPETFLVDTTGRLVERFVGPKDWDQPRYRRAVVDLLDRAGIAAPAAGG